MSFSSVAMGLLVVALLPTLSQAQVERVWLSHRGGDPSKITVNWTTKTPSESLVRFGTTKEYGQQARVEGKRTLHHVEIAIPERGITYHYSVGPAEIATADVTFKSAPKEVLRVAIVANWHAKANLSALVKDDVHLLATAGDNITSLWQRCGIGKKDCYQPYAELIDRYPELFRTTPFMPVLGNHDREIRPRGERPPSEPVYDVEATAFREFFELPGDEWKWSFVYPDFGLRLIGLDLNHTQDFGTTWQTCHDFGRESEQFRWYEKQIGDRAAAFTVTIHNERNGGMRNHAKGAWHELFRQGSACVSGFGYFAERAEVDGFPYINTSLGGKGAKYPDGKSKAFFSEDNYVLITADREKKTLAIELKSLDGKVLDRREVVGK